MTLPRKGPAPGPWKLCDVCGERYPPKRLACPECGADERTRFEPGDEAGVPEAMDEEEYQGVLSMEGLAPERAGAFWRTRRARNMVVGLLLVAAMVVVALNVPALVLLFRR